MEKREIKVGDMVIFDRVEYRIIDDCGDGYLRLRRPGCVETLAVPKNLIEKTI